MVQYLYNQNILIYIYTGLCGLGLLVRFILELIHIRLISESDNLGATKNKTLKHMKMKFETCYKLKIGVNNVDTFVDKNILRYRFCGLLLSTWENISGQVLLLILLIVPVSTVFGVIFDCGQEEIINAGAVGILTGSIIILVDRIVNLSAKKRMIRLNLMDYLENFCKVRLEQEAFHPELLEQYRKEYFQTEMKQVSTAATLTKDESKSEINRRREARLRKEEEKRAMQLRREEQQKQLEDARKEEENKKQEERKRLAAKRREEELLKLEEEREALERRRAELKKKANDKQQMYGKKPLRTEEITKAIRKAEEEYAAAEKNEGMKQVMATEEEVAAELEVAVKEKSESETKPLTAEKTRPESIISPQEEKIIEDILKDFFA